MCFYFKVYTYILNTYEAHFILIMFFFWWLQNQNLCAIYPKLTQKSKDFDMQLKISLHFEQIFLLPHLPFTNPQSRANLVRIEFLICILYYAPNKLKRIQMHLLTLKHRNLHPTQKHKHIQVHGLFEGTLKTKQTPQF